MVEMRGADALVESLLAEDAEVVFGMPGVQVMGALDAFYRHPEIRWISVRHEQSAAFMAFGYARTTGKEGVALVVPGPGALNATAALGTAYAASTPVLLISGQIESYNLGKNHGALHEVDDQIEAFRPLAKWTHRVGDAAEIPGAVAEAMRQLREGRPRPAELEIPWDFWLSSKETSLPGRQPVRQQPPDEKQVTQAAGLLAAASRPLILAGGGAINANASAELVRLAEALSAPVILTDEGKGAVSDRHPLSLGNTLLGAHPALPLADVILAVGSRIQFRANAPWKLGPGQKIIQIDADPAELGRNQEVFLGIAADARLALEAILKALPQKRAGKWQADELAQMRAGIRDTLEKKAPIPLEILDIVHGELGDDGILIPGVTGLGYWSHIIYPVVRPRHYLTSSYFFTLGYAYPTALGAKAGNPEKPVVALCGDGGFLYAASELATAVQESINVVAIVFNDAAFGACLRIQRMYHEDRVIGTKLATPDYARLAESFGALGIKCDSVGQLKGALRTALDSGRPAVIEVPIPEMKSPWDVFLPA